MILDPFHSFIVSHRGIDQLGKSGLKQILDSVWKDKNKFNPNPSTLFTGSLGYGVSDDLKSLAEKGEITEDQLTFWLEQEKNIDDLSWTINSQTQLPARLGDILMFTGYNTDMVPFPNKFKTKRRREITHGQFEFFPRIIEVPGFTSLPIARATAAAYFAMQRFNEPTHKGADFQSSIGDTDYKVSVGQSNHGDLIVKRFDITWYNTTSPFGDTVLFRPIVPQDTQALYAYHGSTIELFAVLLEYSLQVDEASELITNENQAQPLLNEFGEWEESKRNPASYQKPWGIGFDIPHYGQDEHVTKAISRSGSRRYGVFIDEDQNLSFYDVENGKPTTREFTVYKQETDLFIRACFDRARQVNQVRNLLDIVEYRFSDELQQALQQ